MRAALKKHRSLHAGEKEILAAALRRAAAATGAGAGENGGGGKNAAPLRANVVANVTVVAPRQFVAAWKSLGVDVAVDNTFASPYLQQPLTLGADLVVHSTTKYIGGHSDVVGGAVLTSDADWAEHLQFQIKAVGAAPAPLDCFLLLRSTKTLHLRMERHCENAIKVADRLNGHPAIEKVIFPSLMSGEARRRADANLKGGYGSLMGIVLKGGAEAGAKFIDKLEMFYHVANIGDARSLAIHPATTTHSQLSAEEQAATGVTPGYVRLSIGIEHVDDIIADITQALDKAVA